MPFSGSRIRFVAVFALAASLFLAACGSDGKSGGDAGAGTPAADNPGTIKVLLSFQQGISFWPLHLADKLGYFKDEGLDVRVEVADGSPFVVQQVSAGNEPFGVPVPEPAMLGYAQNPSFVSIYEFLTSNTFNLWVRDDSPIQQLSDLKPGSTVGITRQSGGDIPRLTVTLDKVGLTVGKDVNFVEFGFNTANAAEMLQQRKADVVSISWNMFVGANLALEKQGIKLRCLTCDESDQYAAESIIVSKDFLTKHKAAVEGFGRALAKATVFGQTNPDAALTIMKEVAPEEQSDPDYARKFFEAALEVTKPRAEKNQFGWQDKAVYERSMEAMLDPKNPQGLEKAIDLDDFVNNDLVDAYNDFDRDAVKKQAEEWES